MARTLVRRDLYTGQPATGVQLYYHLLNPTERIAYLQRLLGARHGARIRSVRRKLLAMQPGDTYYPQYQHYVTVMPATLRRARRELARLLRVVAQAQPQQRQARQHRARP